MKIVRFAAEGKTGYGILKGQTIQAIEGKPYRGINSTGETFRLKDARLLAPCLPSKIVAMGLNYKKHAEEVKAVLPKEPLIFLKPSTCVIGPEENIIYPPSSTRIDYEGELAIVIKKRACQISEKEAFDYVLGYTCLNDVSARDHQRDDVQWTRSKGFDTFGPMGPCIETDIDPDNVLVETYLNGQLKQSSSTSDMIFPIAAQISFISHVMTLLPGDVITTGTPSGIGAMKPGDTVEIKIEGIGTLRNYVVKNGKSDRKL